MSLNALKEMLAHLGSPYLWGGESWDTGLDCSAAVKKAHRYVGADLRAEDIRRGSKIVSWEAAQPGDVVFLLRGGRAFHVVLFLGWEKDKRGTRALVVGASGGDSTTTSVAEARRRGACVRYDLYNITSPSVEVRRWSC